MSIIDSTITMLADAPDLSALLDQIPAGIIVAEAPSGRIKGYNRRAQQLWGGPLPLVDSVDEYAARFTAVHADGRLYTSEEFPLSRALCHGETVTDEEIEFRTTGGRTRVLLISAAPVRDAAGIARAAVAVLSDVTEHRADERRREFFARLGDMLGGGGDAGEVMRTAAIAIGEHLGVSSAVIAELDATGSRAVFHAEYRNGVVCVASTHRLDDFGERFGAALRSGRTLVIEDIAQHPLIDDEGVEMFAALEARSALAVPVRRDGRAVALVLLLHVAPRRWRRADVQIASQLIDRTWAAVEVARSDTSLEKSEEWLRIALRAGQAAAWEWDLRTDRLLWSGEHHAVLGTAPDRPIASVTEFLALVHADDRARARRAIGRVGRLGRNEVALEYRIMAGTAIRWLRIQGRVLADEAGRPARAVGVLLDVTERKEAELEREALLARLEEANAAKSNFIGVMSHEFRTPLTSVIGYADLLTMGSAGPLTPMQMQQLARIKASAWHLTQVVDEVLAFSRIEAGREVLRVTPVDIAAVAREAAAIVEPDARAKGLVLHCETPRTCSIGSDEGKLRQVLINLLSNAVKFTEQGHVRLTLERADGDINIAVEDTGIGIAREHRTRVFERFWQADQASTRSYGGTGLGLTVTKRLVELLGGSIGVTSELGRGSTFRVVLPVQHRPA